MSLVEQLKETIRRLEAGETLDGMAAAPTPAETRALTTIAQVFGEPGLESDPDRLAHVVNEHYECLSAERMPRNPHLRELMRAASGLRETQVNTLIDAAERMERHDNMDIQSELAMLVGLGQAWLDGLRELVRAPDPGREQDTRPRPEETAAERLRLERELETAERAYLLECGWSPAAGAEGVLWHRHDTPGVYNTAGARAKQEALDHGAKL